MCSVKALMKEVEFVGMSKLMKEHLALPVSETSSLFYRQNHVNKTLTLPFYQHNRCRPIKPSCYRSRAGKCFPAAAPLCCPPMVHRTKQPIRPREPNDVQLPTHKFLLKAFTLKVDKRFLRKD